jgi:hypothetical protein
MGTRSTTRIVETYDGDDTTVAFIYRQMDGYCSGMGNDLAKILNSGTLVNGIGGDLNVFNGMGCLAAQVIKELKDGPGGIYLQNENNGGEDYNYLISHGDDSTLYIEVESGGKVFTCKAKDWDADKAEDALYPPDED